MRIRLLFSLVLVALLTVGCADVTFIVEMNTDGIIRDKQLRVVTDDRLVLNMFLNEFILPSYEEWRQEGHARYIFLEIDDTAPPYRAELFFDYDRARSEGFTFVRGFWGLIDDFGTSADGTVFIRYSNEGEGPVQDESAALWGTVSMSIVTRMPSDILGFNRGFVSRDGREHTVRLSFKELMEEGLEFEVVSESPRWWW